MTTTTARPLGYTPDSPADLALALISTVTAWAYRRRMAESRGPDAPRCQRQADDDHWQQVVNILLKSGCTVADAHELASRYQAEL